MLLSVLSNSALAQSDTRPTATAPADHQAIRQYLSQFKPSAEHDKQVSKLIADLGADEFATRENAMAKLTSLAVTPRRLLTKALKNDDAEIRLRARQLLDESGDDDVQRLQGALATIVRDKIAGLGGDLIPAFEHAASFRRLAVQAMVTTTSAKDATLLRSQLDATSPALREAVVASLGEHLGKKAVSDLARVLNDADERVVLTAARILANQGERASLEPLVRLLNSKNFEIRHSSARILRFVANKKFAYRADRDSDSEENAEPIESWKAWVKGEGTSVALRFPLKLDDVLQLFNGQDLEGWQAVVTGVAVKETDVWQAKDGKIVCNGSGNGYIRTKRKFANYRLKVDYRWPKQGGDSGVWIMMPGPDARLPRGLEVQLLANKAGDFWALGGFACKVRGQPLSGYGAKIAQASEKQLGQWNTCELTLLNGKLTVKINGTEQNNATDCPKEPGHIALQVEGTPIEFRRVELQPLSP